MAAIDPQTPQRNQRNPRSVKTHFAAGVGPIIEGLPKYPMVITMVNNESHFFKIETSPCLIDTSPF